MVGKVGFASVGGVITSGLLASVRFTSASFVGSLRSELYQRACVPSLPAIRNCVDGLVGLSAQPAICCWFNGRLTERGPKFMP